MSFDLPLFKRLLTAETPDVYVCEPPATTAVVVNAVARVRKKPWAYYAADIWSAAARSFGAPFPVVKTLEKLEKTMLNASDLVLTVSPSMSQRLQGIGVRKERIKIVGNGVDMEVFNDSVALPENKLASKPYFVYAGTLSAWQGIDIFIKALPEVLKQYPEINFIILGQGDHEEQLNKVAASTAPDNIHFLGVKPGAEAASWIAHAEAALVSVDPSQGYSVAQPTKTFAASACGTPVIYAGNDAGRDLVEKQNLGIAVDYDQQQTAEAMIQILDTPWEDRKELIQWVEENASLNKIGLEAASLILDLAN